MSPVAELNATLWGFIPALNVEVTVLFEPEMTETVLEPWLAT